MNAWYHSDKSSFLAEKTSVIVGKLTTLAGKDNLSPEDEQVTEWEKSIELLKNVLNNSSMNEIDGIILEYDFRRRGLRMDCILTAPGIIIVIEFKRNKIDSTTRDQVMNYCVNLIEFHDETQKVIGKEGVVIPILCTTTGSTPSLLTHDEFYHPPWGCLLNEPLESDKSSLLQAIENALKLRRPTKTKFAHNDWVDSNFKPSSTILDAVISLYGQHEVSAISSHGAAIRKIQDCTKEIKDNIIEAKKRKQNLLIFLSGAPGAGKTLVGMNLIFDSEFREDSVYVTGNAPLVDVLNKALEKSYQKKSKGNSLVVPSGYAKDKVKKLVKNATFKITKAHHFLPKKRGGKNASEDGYLLILDEAQRTYEDGHRVAGSNLPDHEANLILDSMANTYPDGAVVVVLIGHNQAINLAERGMIAWFEAAENATTGQWKYAISDATLDLPNAFPTDTEKKKWQTSKLRKTLAQGHLPNSMRHYRSNKIEQWVGEVLEGTAANAKKIASSLKDSDKVFITRDLEAAKSWIRKMSVGDLRSGMLASSGARRLCADGIYVAPKSEAVIVNWMLQPSGDFRSSNMLEKAVTQYDIQGLEIDYSLVCWDADLRRAGDDWVCFNMVAPKWCYAGDTEKRTEKERVEIRRNTYRVLLTRSRKGMVIFVPEGDRTGRDETRNPKFYDGIFDYLVSCGVEKLS